MDYIEARDIFEREARLRQIDTTRSKDNPNVYEMRGTMLVWAMFVRGMEIGESLTLLPERFEEKVYEVYGRAAPDDKHDVVFLTRERDGV